MFSWKSFRRRRPLSRFLPTRRTASYHLQSNLFYIVCLLVLLYIWSSIRSAHEMSTPNCTTMSEDTYQADMHRFTNKIHLILDKLHIKHFLCYNALWGQLRYRRMLHWQREIEICVVRKSQNSFEGLEEVFQDQDIDIIYKSRKAEYLLNTETLRGRVNLVVFQLDPISSVYYRPGWIYKVVAGETFPSYLINGTELPLKPFGAYSLPVPQHGIEIQKYHFPDSWWKNQDPIFC